MQDGNLIKKYLKFVSLSIGGIIFYSIYSVVDGIFVGRGIGVEALSAVNVTMPFITFLFSLSMLFSVGSLNIVSFSLGKNDKKRANQYFTQTILIAGIVGLIIALISFFNIDLIADFLGKNDDIKKYVIDYAKIIAIFSPFIILTYVFELLVKAEGKPTIGFILMLISACINIVLDYLFVFYYNFGIQGAAWATGISQFTPSIIYAVYFSSKKSRLNFVKVKFNYNILINIIKYGIPAFLAELSTGFIIFIFNNKLATIQGIKGLAIFSIIMYILNLFTNIMLSVNQGTQPLISYYIGKKDIKSVKLLKKMMYLIVFSITILVFSIIQIWTDEIINIFLDETKLKFLNEAIMDIRIYSFALLILGFNIVTGGYLTSVRMPRKEFIISILRGYVLVALSVNIIPSIFGINSIWYAMIVSEFITLVVSIVFLLNIKRGKLED
ncbi:MATE family efflux transporter [Helcococcus ovis]|uniref:Multidrug export protein MepA n=1 Tax=Helcococcus ovis TaxID=72026 RepID=A0A4V3IYG3_9FIRM|nr:MATE family efflux transporter [Helcococcus ovis]TFF65537.1 MATE family efflux transporter [Helcococcus ovis]TFF67641.1 MATE family efflux transporter [Helcococcus ovis]